MFKKLETSYPAGIGRYRALNYAWRGAYLHGHASALEEKPDEIALFASPDIERLRALDAAPGQHDGRSSLACAFNNRGVTLFIGQYDSLDASAAYIYKLESLFAQVLSEQGAEDRVLRAGQLQPAHSPAAAESFGEALRRARAEEIFALLRADKPVPFNQMAGRLFRPLANALNISYNEEVERTDPGKTYVSIAHTYDRLARFTFLSNGDDDFPTVIRASWNENSKNYSQSWSGPGTLANLRRHVFGWLADALAERTQEDPAPQRPAALITAITPEDFLRVLSPNHREAASEAYNYAPTRPAPDAARQMLDRINPPRAPFLRIVK